MELVSFTPRPLYACYRLNRKLGGPQEPISTFRRSLYRLSYPGLYQSHTSAVNWGGGGGVNWYRQFQKLFLQLPTQTCRRQGNVTRNITETGWERENWTHLGQNTVGLMARSSPACNVTVIGSATEHPPNVILLPSSGEINLPAACTPAPCYSTLQRRTPSEVFGATLLSSSRPCATSGSGKRNYYGCVSKFDREILSRGHGNIQQPNEVLESPAPPLFIVIVEIKSKSVQRLLNSIHYTELHVSTYFRSSSGSQFLFITYLGRNINS
jgi:hypothetical protein